MHTRQVRGGSLEEGGGMFPSPPTFIRQDPADVDGEVLEGEDERAGREGKLLKEGYGLYSRGKKRG